MVETDRPMPQFKLDMRQVLEVLRLKHEHHLSIREIARSCVIPSSTVGDYLLRVEAAQLGWPLPEDAVRWFKVSPSAQPLIALTAYANKLKQASGV